MSDEKRIETGIPAVCTKCGHSGDVYIGEGELMDIFEILVGEAVPRIHAELLDRLAKAEAAVP